MKENTDSHKKKNTEINGVITEREKQACQWICEQGAMTVDQLWRAVWSRAELTTGNYVYRRIAFLEKTGFLAKIRTSKSRKTFFKATRRGHEIASELGLAPLHAPREGEITHTEGLTEIRLAVIKAGRLDIHGEYAWRTDRVLNIDPQFHRERFYQHLPDAIWRTASGKKIAIEYERTRKSPTRVRQKIEAFSREMSRSDREFDMVLWITTPGVEVMVRGLILNHPNHVIRSMNEFMSELNHSNQLN